jgi:hypothetical protein
MMITVNYFNFLKIIVRIIFLIIIVVSCTEDNSTLAPYVGPPGMSKITLETGSTTPRINWVGGYVTVLGVNQGSNPALDSTLIWLIYQSGDQIRYPVRYGELPAGAQDITTSYGGEFLSELVEDSTYSFWIMKQEDWNQISSSQNKYLNLDSSITTISSEGDTINFPPKNYSQIVAPLDNYINIKDVTTRGRLADLFVKQPTTNNNPTISWNIKQIGVTDTLISVIGICAAGQFDAGAIVWEVYSISDTAGITYYGKANVIPGPLETGQVFAQTFVFTEYPENGLERDKTYFLYIANKDWNGEDYTRTADYYCYVTFNTY